MAAEGFRQIHRNLAAVFAGPVGLLWGVSGCLRHLVLVLSFLEETPLRRLTKQLGIG